uniref:Uncharacterized protein n=1 Tax=Sander lucioperca TaxID=283035 RepID=A0A8C9X9D5_SANLU
MPRGKGYRRSLAGKLKYAKRNTPQLPTPEVILVPRGGACEPCKYSYMYTCCGTGVRHRVNEWTRSKVTGKQHKFIIPPEVPDKKFILIVGDSHLRAIVDGIVPMPKSQDIPLSFGFMSTPGGTAADLRAELDNALLPRIPDAICLLAPSNNLTANQTISEAAADFRKLLVILTLYVKVFVVDFPPRLNIDLDVQRHYREEYHRVAALLDMFPLNNLKLDSSCILTHLSDNRGMPILVNALYMACYVQFLEPRQDPAPVGWKVVGPGRKVITNNVFL